MESLREKLAGDLKTGESRQGNTGDIPRAHRSARIEAELTRPKARGRETEGQSIRAQQPRPRLPLGESFFFFWFLAEMRWSSIKHTYQFHLLKLIWFFSLLGFIRNLSLLCLFFRGLKQMEDTQRVQVLHIDGLKEG